MWELGRLGLLNSFQQKTLTEIITLVSKIPLIGMIREIDINL